MANVVWVARGVGLLTSLFIFCFAVLSNPVLGAEYTVSPLLPTTIGGKTFWADVTERGGAAPYQDPGTSFAFTLTATGSTNGTFAAPASAGFAARSGPWTAGFTGGGTVQQGGNYLFIKLTGLHADGIEDTFTFYPVYSGPNQIPCNYYMSRGGSNIFNNGSDDYQRGNVRVTDGAAPAPFAPKFNSVFGGFNYFSGSSPALSANVVGSYPLYYRWSKDSVPIPYGTNATLVLTNIQTGGAGTYTIVVSNSVGVISSNLAVTVSQSVPPVITKQPTNDIIFPNSTLVFNVGATGTAPLIYQWRKDGVNLEASNYALGVTNSNLGIYNFNATNAGNYDVVITNYAGSVTSAVAVITLGTAPVLNQSPAGTNLIEGQTLLLTASASGPSLFYSWYKATTFIVSSTNNFYARTNMLYADRGDYTVRVSNPAGTVTSAVAHVEMYIPNLPSYFATLPNVTTNAGVDVSFVGYYYSVPPPIFTWRKNGVNIPGATGLAPNIVSNYTYFYSFFTLTNISVADIGSYSVIASNAFGVSEIPAANLIIPQSAPPTITYQPTNQTLFTGDSAALRVGCISQTATNVRWYSNSVLVATTTTNYAPVLALVGNYSFFATVSNIYGVSTSLTANVTVKVRPGNVDTTFNPTASFDAALNAVVPQGDGKVIVGGLFTFYGSSNRSRVARLLADGSLDTTWVAASNTLNAAVYALSEQADGRLLVAGDFTLIGTAPGRRYSGLARLNTDGKLDTNFLCYTADGSLSISNSVKAISQRGDGYFAASGKFTNVQGNLQQCVALFDSNGVFQTGYRPTFTMANASVLTVDALAFQADGKLLIGGVFTNVGGAARYYLARLTTSGANDSTFNPTPSSPTRCILPLPDGRFIAGGASSSTVSRYATNGAFDNVGFGQGVGGGTGVYALAQQTSGHVLIGGDYLNIITTPNHGYLVRVRGDGAADPSFKTYPVGPVNAIAVGADGGIWIVGNFTAISPEGIARPRVAKLIGEAPPVVAPTIGTPILVSGALQLQFAAANGRSYQIEYKTHMGQPTWSLYQAVSGDGTVKTVSIPATGTSAFFRINLLP